MFDWLESLDWCCVDRGGRCIRAGAGVSIAVALAAYVIGFGGELDFAFSSGEESE